jgi:hypothetical protein
MQSSAGRFLTFVTGRSGNAVNAVIVILMAVVLGLWLGPLERADVIGLEGVLIAVLFGSIAVRTAVSQQRDLIQVLEAANAHEISLHDVRDSIETVTGDAMRRMSDALLTEHLGSAPDYLSDITALMARANRSLRVLCDHPGYLIFSGGPPFDEYLRVLREKIASCTTVPPRMRVNLLFLAERERRELHEHQVRPDAVDAQTWADWRTSETEFRRRPDGEVEQGRLPGFWARSGLILGSDEIEVPDELSADQLIQRFLSVNDSIRDKYLTGADVHELQFRDAEGNPTARRNGPSIYFWLRDEDDPREAEAIFVIVPLGSVVERAREQGFSTRDPELINALVGVFERYRLGTTVGEAALRPS